MVIGWYYGSYKDGSDSIFVKKKKIKKKFYRKKFKKFKKKFKDKIIYIV
jgi:hypothetical protein